jgi:hypothetical protein
MRTNDPSEANGNARNKPPASFDPRVRRSEGCVEPRARGRERLALRLDRQGDWRVGSARRGLARAGRDRGRGCRRRRRAGLTARQARTARSQRPAGPRAQRRRRVRRAGLRCRGLWRAGLRRARLAAGIPVRRPGRPGRTDRGADAPGDRGRLAGRRRLGNPRPDLAPRPLGPNRYRGAPGPHRRTADHHAAAERPRTAVRATECELGHRPDAELGAEPAPGLRTPASGAAEPVAELRLRAAAELRLA